MKKRMKCGHTAFVILLLVATLTVKAQTTPARTAQFKRPALVVGIVVDQMRWDYLYRYADRYSEGGFKRMLREGFSCENTFINYLPSVTAIGHSSIYTGSVPAIHGITGNNWIDQLTGRSWYCTEDTAMQTVGSSSSEGKMSPHNLLASTITDELRLASNFRSKVVGVSLKDRAAILPAGHTPTAAFWLEDESGKFITSTWYMKNLPEWVEKFNDRKEPESLMAKGWNTLYPIGTYSQSTADDVAWEKQLDGEKDPVFPHRLDRTDKNRFSLIRPTPFGNTLTLDFATAAIEGYGLGKGAFTDFLTINCASTDYVGHSFAPNSIEIEDTYLRLDRDLSQFFAYLDKKIGKGNYLVFLTADHGGAHAADFMTENRLNAGLVNNNDYIKPLNELLSRTFQADSLVLSSSNYHYNFNTKLIQARSLDFDRIKRIAVDFLASQLGVQFAVDIDHIGDAAVPEPIRQMIINGYNKKRTGPVMIIPEPGWFAGSKRGTTHGTWNPFDTHIPLLFMGWNIHPGSLNRLVHMTDIAPTIAALLRIQMPNGCVGKPVDELTNKLN